MPICTVRVVFSTDDESAAANVERDVLFMIRSAVESVSVISATFAYEDGPFIDLLSLANTPDIDHPSQAAPQEEGAQTQTQSQETQTPSQDSIPTGREF